ncbi:MAG TPA: class D sortase [Terriglobales bacterium]|nr:class D sortase [Terriglobales bacterium]
MATKPRFWLDRALLLIGGVLLAVYAVSRVDAFIHSRAQLRAFHSQGSAGGREVAKPNGSAVDFSLWSEKRIKEYHEALLADSRVPVAVLRIPKLGLEVPVLEGTDELTLNRGVGWIAGTARPFQSGNIGIAGHRDGFFRGLKDIAPGDVLELDSAGAHASYAVDEIEIVEPKDGAVLRPRSKPAVTLVTCYPFYFVGSAPNRFIVHASLTQVTPATTAQVASEHAPARNENN